MATKKNGTGKTVAPAAQAAVNLRTPAPRGSVERQTQILTNFFENLMGRSRFLSRAGLQYGGKRDVYEVAGYIPLEKDDFDYYWGLYTRGDIAGRIVDMPAKTTWRTPPDVQEENQPDGTDFTNAFEAMADRLKLWQYFERVDRLAGVGEFAVLLLGVRGVDDQGLRNELGRVNPDDLIYVSVYPQRAARIATWVTDTGDPRFGQPLTYDISFSQGNNGFGKMSAIVHWSRIIHVAEDLLLDEVYGRPRLQRALNRLFDLDKITASTGESYWQAAARILQAKLDVNAQPLTDDELTELDNKLGELVHDLRRQFTGQGAELGWLPTQVSPVKDIRDLYFELIAAASGIPRRILFGNETGELASTTDQATYFGMINERQEHFAEPQILRQFIDRLTEAEILPAPGADGYDVEWPTLFELTELEQADANLKRAQTAAALTPMGGDPLALVEIDEHSNVWLVPRDAPPPQEVGDHAPAPTPPAPATPPGGGDNTPPPGDGKNPPPTDPNAPAPADHTPPTSTATNLPPEMLVPPMTYPERLALTQVAGQVQMLIFPRAHWPSVATVKAWARAHRFHTDKVDEQPTDIRLTQAEVSYFREGSFRTVCLFGADAPGARACKVKAVLGRPRPDGTPGGVGA